MAEVWSDERKLASWLEVELAAVDAWAEFGVVPREAAETIRATAVTPTPERVAELERETNHDLAAFVDAVQEGLGDEGRWVHYGLTSSDVVDTALALQLRDAGVLLLEGVARAQVAVIRRAEEHRLTLCMGRTHGVHAEPTTFGLKLAGWAFELDRGRERLRHALDGVRFGKLSGAVGTYSVTDPELERIACERLGLEPEPVSTQIVPRDRHAELLSALALVASSLDRFATEIRHLARTEVREVQEPFGKGQKGSSAMPHKRNPITAERICGLARVRSRLGAGRARERRPLARAGHLALLRRAGRHSRCVPGARLHARPLRLARRGAGRPARADARQPGGEPRPLLLAAGAAGAGRVRAAARRGLPARPGARSARLGRGARLPHARRGRPADRRPHRPVRRVSTSVRTRATSTPFSNALPP